MGCSLSFSIPQLMSSTPCELKPPLLPTQLNMGRTSVRVRAVQGIGGSNPHYVKPHMHPRMHLSVHTRTKQQTAIIFWQANDRLSRPPAVWPTAFRYSQMFSHNLIHLIELLRRIKQCTEPSLGVPVTLHVAHHTARGAAAGVLLSCRVLTEGSKVPSRQQTPLHVPP